MKPFNTGCFLILLLSVFSCDNPGPPAPLGPLPSERQLAWHDLEYYGFLHFNMNTFTNREWGLGDEPPKQFRPTALDARQWARVAREAGMKGLIITAKHHDGFCLWPTKTTGHSVKNSAWRDGKGDVLRELSDACREYGLKFGVYLSPWDRNHAQYGQASYIEDYHEQLRELLTNYGEIFEVWFDGANGGSGYYGGANETRKIDNKTYYQWDKVTSIVRELQPQAVIFSDGGPDIRWVGNEEGWANETNWSIMRRDEIYPGWPRYRELRSGHEDGTHWLPAEADVSIRPGWYYHPSEDHQVKSLPQLLDIYYNSVGRNASLLLNLPVDTRGLIHETDSARLMEFRQQLDRDFEKNLAPATVATATNFRGGSDQFGPRNTTDGDPETYWATDDGVTTAEITLTFEHPTAFNRIVLQEYLPLGQRVQEFRVEALTNGAWKDLASQTTIGHKRILRLETLEATAVRVSVARAKGPLAIASIDLYEAPNLMLPPMIRRNREGRVQLDVPDADIAVFYTLDGSRPTVNSKRYSGPFPLDSPARVAAIGADPESGSKTGVAMSDFDIPRKDWKLVWPAGIDTLAANKMMDEDPLTFWAPEKGMEGNNEVVIDLGREYRLTGFTFWPMQERWSFGIFTNYEFLVSSNGKQWELAAKGEFSNIVNNPIGQRISFAARTGRFIKLKAVNVQGDDPRAAFGEIGILTAN
jgi:alpha-L-fucosidase